jgi:hypothetical protein
MGNFLAHMVAILPVLVQSFLSMVISIDFRTAFEWYSPYIVLIFGFILVQIVVLSIMIDN